MRGEPGSLESRLGLCGTDHIFPLVGRQRPLGRWNELVQRLILVANIRGSLLHFRHLWIGFDGRCSHLATPLWWRRPRGPLVGWVERKKARLQRAFFSNPINPSGRKMMGF